MGETGWEEGHREHGQVGGQGECGLGGGGSAAMQHRWLGHQRAPCNPHHPPGGGGGWRTRHRLYTKTHNAHVIHPVATLLPPGPTSHTPLKETLLAGRRTWLHCRPSG